MNFISSYQSFSSINAHFIHNHKRCLWQFPGDFCRMDSKPKHEPTSPLPGGLPWLPTACQAEVKPQAWKIPDLLPIQAWNKSCPINDRVKVLIHWSNVVAIQFGVLRSGPQIMRFLCTWWLHRTASQKQRRLGLQDMAYDGPVASIDSRAIVSQAAVSELAVSGISKKTQRFDPDKVEKV